MTTALDILTSARDRLTEEVTSNQAWRNSLEQRLDDSLQRETELLAQIAEIEVGIATLASE